MRKLKVLVVEDTLSNQKLYDTVLVNDVFEKRFANDGREGLEAYKSWHPDMILLDLGLPVMSGYALLNEIRVKINDQKTTIIIQTSVSKEDDIKACAKLGIQGYIVKPFSPMEVAGKILSFYETDHPEEARAALEKIKTKETVQHLMKPISTKPLSPEEAEYMEEIRLCLESGPIKSRPRMLLDRMRQKMGITEKRAVELEKIASDFQSEYTDEETEYMDELKFCLKNGTITEEERAILGRLRQRLNISPERATALEQELEGPGNKLDG